MLKAWAPAAKAVAGWIAAALLLAGCGSNGSSVGIVDIRIEPQGGVQLAKGTTAPLRAIALYSNGYKEDVSDEALWESADPLTAAIGALAENGRLIYGTSVGTTQVTARYSGFDDRVSVTVTQAVATALAISPSSVNQPKGTSRALAATATFSDGSSQDVTNDAVWTSSVPEVATVGDSIGSKGRLNALELGTTTVTAAFQSLSSQAAVTVTGAAVSSVEVSPASQSIARGTAQPFVATALFTDGTTQDVTTAAEWTSSDTGVAEVGNTAGTKGIAQAVDVGTAEIRAAYLGKNGAGTLTVTPAALTGVEIAPLGPTIAKGTTRQFTATAVFADGTKQNVTTVATWDSSDTTVATVGNGTGTSGRAQALAVGTTEITVTYNDQSATTTLTVTDAVVTSIDVTPANPTIAKGTQQQFTATAVFSDNSTQDITSLATWSTSDGAVAGVSDAGDSKGLATGLSQGNAQIRAAYQDVTGTTTLTVTAATVTNVQVSPTDPSIAKGTSQQFTATATFSDASTQDVTASAVWSSSSTAVATVSNAGATKGKAQGVAEGTADIRASFGGQSGQSRLTVTAAVLTELQVSPTAPSIAKGTAQQFTATAVFSDATTQNVTVDAVWSSSDTDVATVSNANGTNGRAQGVGVGSAQITATYQGESAVATLTVSGAVLTAVEVTPANPSIAKGTQQQFTATAVFSDATTQDVTDTAAWTSTNTNVATVSNADGSEGRASGVNPGNATIRATYESLSGSTVLTVTAAEVTALQLTPAGPSIAKGTAQQFTATATFTDGSQQNVTNVADWASSDTDVATVSTSGSARGRALGVGVGTSDISVAYGGQSQSTTLTVTPAVLSEIQVTPSTAQLPAGRVQQYTATGVYSDGSTQDLTDSVTWASTATAVIDISNAAGSKGVATAKAAGNAVIRATQADKVGETTVQVTSAVLEAIEITPADARLPVGFKRSYTATGLYSDGSSRDITGTATWSSSDTAVASISNGAADKGVATGVAAGTANIKAAVGAVEQTTPLTVTTATLSRIEVTPGNKSIPLGTSQQYTATAVFSDNSSIDFTSQVSWQSTATAVATVSSSGKATSVATGSTNIVATYSGTSGQTTLTVSNAALVSIAVTPSSATVAKGRTTQFEAIGTFTAGDQQNITADVNWSSSNTGVASVSNATGSKGLATGVTIGNATITATLGGKSGTAALTISAAVLESIAVSSTQTGSLPDGRTRQYAARGFYSDGSDRSITAEARWSSSNESIATVSNADGQKGLVRAVDPGNVTVSATLDGIRGDAALTVSSAVLQSIAIAPVAPSVPAGLSQQFEAFGTYSDGSTLDITDDVTWSSSNVAVATIGNAENTHGRAETKTTGNTTIKAVDSATTIEKSTTLTVTAAQLQSITVAPRDATIGKPREIPLNYGVEFVATGLYSDGSMPDLTEQASWASLGPGIVEVGNDAGVNKGYARARQVGSTTIRASFGGIVGTTFVEGTAAALTSIDVTPKNQTISFGDELQFKATGAFDNASSYDITREATWTSSNSNAASISNEEGSEGLATAGFVPGQTTIGAASAGKSATTTLTNSPF